MKDNSEVKYLKPDVGRDAPFAHGWLSSPEGKETLLSMGNADSEIKDSTIEDQRKITQSFIDLENQRKQITWVISLNGVSLGVVWIDLIEKHNVKPPSIHIMIGDTNFRRKGIGRNAISFAIDYAQNELGYKTIYSRHLKSNIPIEMLFKSFGFETDGNLYTDENGLVWQNVKLSYKKEDIEKKSNY